MGFETGEVEGDVPPKRSAIWAILLDCEDIGDCQRREEGKVPLGPEGAFGVWDGEWLSVWG